MLIGGEENDFFERMMRGGETCWYVPNAVMWHIIPPGKLTEDYFKDLIVVSYNEVESNVELQSVGMVTA